VKKQKKFRQVYGEEIRDNNFRVNGLIKINIQKAKAYLPTLAGIHSTGQEWSKFYWFQYVNTRIEQCGKGIAF